MIRLRAAWDYLRHTYWAVPSAMALAAAVLAVAMIELDAVVTATLLDRLSWVYTGSAEGARAVLSAIAGSMIGVAGVTFSITIVALTLASQQFGPRLLRSFLRDPGNQIVLGTFVSTFIYCLLVLRTVRGGDGAAFVPHLSVTIGVALALLSLGVLIFFIHHVATSIQASRIIANVAADIDAAVDHLFPERIGQELSDESTEDSESVSHFGSPGQARAVRSDTSGYVQAIDGEGLLAAAEQRQAVLRLESPPGSFVRTGALLMTVHAGQDLENQGDAALRRLVMIGAERTGTQDLEFFLDQLVELAVRALSPGINDPATARSCIDRLEHAFCALAQRRFPSRYRYDAGGNLRVITPPTTFGDLLNRTFDELGRYAQSSVSVTSRLIDALREIAACTRRELDWIALRRQADTIVGRSRLTPLAAADRDVIDTSYRALLIALESVRLKSSPPGT